MTHSVIMPDLGQTVSEGKVLRWLKKPGDTVKKGEPLFEVETDKVTVEVEAYRDGTLREILAGEGQVASALTAVAILTDDAREPYERPAPLPPSAVPASPLASAPPAASSAPREIVASPAARSLARELGVQLDGVTGTGPQGLITRRDIERPAPARSDSSVLSEMAAITAKSKQTIPHFYATLDVDVAASEKWRENWNAAHPALPATANDVFVRAAARALRDVPVLGASAHGETELRSTADVLLIVAVERGLRLVPVPDPSQHGWEEYLRMMKSLLQRAKEGRIRELSSPSAPRLAISNLGAFGVKQFTAIIPPACAAILAIGAIREAAVVRNKKVAVGEICSLTLSADHRIVDGIAAAKFLERMQAHLDSL